jgi:hypothetical protein
MTKKPDITTIASGYYSRQALNTNFENLQDGFDNTMSLDGSTPNSMGADIDLNNNDILNGRDVAVQSLTIAGQTVNPTDLAASGASIVTDDFTGNGSTTTFTLSYSPQIKDHTSVYINGVYQNKIDYNVTTTALTFNSPPPLDSAIEVQVFRSLLTGTTPATNVSYNQGSTGAVDRTAQVKMQETISVKDFGAVGDGVADDTTAMQNYINAVAAKGIKQYRINGKYRITAQIDMADGQFVGDGAFNNVESTIVTDTTLTRADGCVFINTRGASGVKFIPTTNYVEDLFRIEFLFSLHDCRINNYNAAAAKADNDANFTDVYITKCHLLNTRHAILTDALEAGSVSDNNVVIFKDNYCYGVDGVIDVTADPDKYHGYQGKNIGTGNGKNAFIVLGETRSLTMTGNTFERRHYILYAEQIAGSEINGNYFEAVDLDYVINDNSDNRPVVLGDYHQGNNTTYRAYENHSESNAPANLATLIVVYENLSGTFSAGETVTTSAGDSAKVIEFDTSPTILKLSSISGTLSNGETITGSTSGATADIQSKRDVLSYNSGIIHDDTDGLSAGTLRTNNILGHASPMTISGGSDASTGTAHNVIPVSNNWFTHVVENGTKEGNRVGFALNIANASASYTNKWVSFEAESTSNLAQFKMYRRNAGSTQGIFTINTAGDFLNITGTYGTISDENYKQQIVSASSQWDDIKAVDVVNYKLNSLVETMGDDAPSYLGVTAQQLETVGLNGLVSIDENTEQKAVKYSILYMKAVKALQEAMDRIEQLEARVTALEP